MERIGALRVGTGESIREKEPFSPDEGRVEGSRLKKKKKRKRREKKNEKGGGGNTAFGWVVDTRCTLTGSIDPV